MMSVWCVCRVYDMCVESVKCMEFVGCMQGGTWRTNLSRQVVSNVHLLYSAHKKSLQTTSNRQNIISERCP